MPYNPTLVGGGVRRAHSGIWDGTRRLGHGCHPVGLGTRRLGHGCHPVGLGTRRLGHMRRARPAWALCDRSEVRCTCLPLAGARGGRWHDVTRSGRLRPVLRSPKIHYKALVGVPEQHYVLASGMRAGLTHYTAARLGFNMRRGLVSRSGWSASLVILASVCQEVRWY